MRKCFLLITIIAFTIPAFAQEDMPVIWETKLDHKIDYNGTGNEERGYSYAASDKELSIIDNATGKVRWTKSFKELAPKLNKIDELIPFWEGNAIFLFDKRGGKDQMAVVDMKTGNLLWNTDEFKNITDDNVTYIGERDAFVLGLKDQIVYIKAKTGEQVWSTDKIKGAIGKYVYMPDGNMVAVNFMPSFLSALFKGFKNQIFKINLDNGEIVWENSYIGMAERKVISREFLFDLNVRDDKVYLSMNGIQAYDYNTGASLWSAAFDITPDRKGVVGAPKGTKKFGIYGAVADPVLKDNDLYVLDMSNKKNQYLKKFDKNTGKLMWSTKDIKGARVIPNMYVVKDKVLIQIGGVIEAQAYIVTKDADGNWVKEWRIWYPSVKPYGVQAYDANNGALAWESEKFKKGITNMVMSGENVLVCSGKAFYSINYATGEQNYEVDAKNGGVGNATQIIPYKDKVAIIGEKGVSTFKVSDGSLIAAGKYKNSDLEDKHENIVIMKTKGADIAAFNLDDDCKYKEFKARKGATTTLMDQGKYVYVYEKKVVTKLESY